MTKKHLDCFCHLCRSESEDGIKNPRGFDERQVRDPGATRNEGFRGCSLGNVVSGDEPNQDVGINGAHDAFASRNEHRL